MPGANARANTSEAKDKDETRSGIVSNSSTVLRTRIANHRWRTGVFLPDDLRAQVVWRPGATTPDASSRIIVVSHPCDILCHDFDHEPVVEVIIGRSIDAIAEEFTRARNPRKLHLSLNEGAVELNSRDRGDLSRPALADSRPDTNALSDADSELVLAWLGRRYQRTAFPDALMERMKLRRAKIRQLQKKAGPRLRDIYIKVLNNRELGPNEDYNLVFYFVLNSKLINDEISIGEFNRDFFTPFMTSINAAPGITIVKGECINDLLFTYSTMMDLDLFDVDLDLQYQRDRL